MTDISTMTLCHNCAAIIPIDDNKYVECILGAIIPIDDNKYVECILTDSIYCQQCWQVHMKTCLVCGDCCWMSH